MLCGEDAGPVQEDVVPFVLEGGEVGGGLGGEGWEVVDWDVVGDGAGEGVGDWCGFGGELFEVVEGWWVAGAEDP